MENLRQMWSNRGGAPLPYIHERIHSNICAPSTACKRTRKRWSQTIHFWILKALDTYVYSFLSMLGKRVMHVSCSLVVLGWRVSFWGADSEPHHHIPILKIKTNYRCHYQKCSVWLPVAKEFIFTSPLAWLTPARFNKKYIKILVLMFKRKKAEVLSKITTTPHLYDLDYRHYTRYEIHTRRITLMSSTSISEYLTEEGFWFHLVV